MTDRAMAKRRKRSEQVARTPGVRTIDRPLEGGGSFHLAYTRTGPEGGLPVFVIPGGPGLASVLPYRGLRAKSEKLGLDLVMMEHRGVGLSRTNENGIDLPRKVIAITEVLDDAAAILDAEGIDQVLVYGASYGSYLAQGFGVRHSERVAGMILDSAMINAGSDQLSTRMLQSLFWDGTPATQHQADTVRRLVERGTVDADEMFPLQFLYEFGGLPSVDRMLALLEQSRGRRVWKWINRLGTREVMSSIPFVMEFDLVGEIAFRELGYAPITTDAPLKVSDAFANAAHYFSPFQGEPFSLVDALPDFSWPSVIISGNHDVRTPRIVAEQIAALIPNATVLPVRDHGHSALDTHPALALEVTRAMVDSIRTSGTIDPAVLPSDPHGIRGPMHRIISNRLFFARFAPRAFS
ncbi:alpha/beta fold hydrolase [Cryobacterium sp. Y50]|uniref:alpha/beta fold hydrolase n=1 Tax=Cryobacterium sp. Y50 TaxID=2048286 RepID=UPI001304D5B6|nr:alpha/beta fold hydrolase [Cryobacterium sp. Y50]